MQTKHVSSQLKKKPMVFHRHLINRFSVNYYPKLSIRKSLKAVCEPGPARN